MGILGKLFDKKTCDLCGGDIGLLGNRKLEDGNCCKKCAGKLSPYFDDRRHSTVEDIRAQLAYREQNQQEVNTFHATRIIGKDTKIYLNENTGKLLISSYNDYKDENPDIIDITKITNCDYRIDESHYEEKQTVKDEEGKSRQESYNPPHYHYSYNFKMTINVDHPYFDEIRFDVNAPMITIKTVGLIGDGTARTVTSNTAEPAANSNGLLGLAKGLLDALTDTVDPRLQSQEYVEYLNIANDMKDTLLSVRNRFMGITTAEPAPAPAPAPAVELLFTP